MHRLRVTEDIELSADLFRYVALGDSTSVGVGANHDGGYPERIFRRLKAHGINAGILNLSQSGATTQQVVQGQVQKAATKNPSLVTLGIGTNDAWRMVPMGTFEANLKLIGNALEKLGVPIVVSNLIDLTQAPIGALVESLISVPRAVVQRRISDMNDRINQMGRRPNFHVVDLFSFSQREIAKHPEYFAADGFHPSAAGYDAWSELMWPVVEKALSLSASAHT